MLRSVPAEAVATLRETRTLLSDMRAGLAQGGGLDETMRNLAAASDNLARFSTRLERDPLSVVQRRKLPAKPAGPALHD